MLLTIDTSGKRPIYQQIADGIKALIARGELKPGSDLPPVRQLAADLGVNLNTVATAYRDLQAEGLLIVRHGSGAIVSSRRLHEPAAEELRGPLRTALTQMVLAGMTRAKILSMVGDELGRLMREAK